MIVGLEECKKQGFLKTFLRECRDSKLSALAGVPNNFCGYFYDATCNEEKEDLYYDNLSIDGIFPYSNEGIADSIKAYYNIENNNEEKRDFLKGKSVATVGSSGDQLLSSILYGAKDVTLIDGNPLSQVFIELKIAAIKNLSMYEYLDYINDKNIFNKEYYNKISKDLSFEVKNFWDFFINKIDINKDDKLKQKVTNAFFTILEYDNADKFSCDYCRNLCDYMLLKSRLKNGVKIDYKIADFNDFSKELGEKKFDLIMLSNIAAYVPYTLFSCGVDDLISNNLKPNGKIQIGYIYNNGFDTSEVDIEDQVDLSQRLYNFRFNGVLKIKDVTDVSSYYVGRNKSDSMAVMPVNMSKTVYIDTDIMEK